MVLARRSARVIRIDDGHTDYEGKTSQYHVLDHISTNSLERRNLLDSYLLARGSMYRRSHYTIGSFSYHAMGMSVSLTGRGPGDESLLLHKVLANQHTCT